MYKDQIRGKQGRDPSASQAAEGSCGLKKVFITPDLTRKQQEVDKKLRDKLKELRTIGSDEYRIKRGKI